MKGHSWKPGPAVEPSIHKRSISWRMGSGEQVCLWSICGITGHMHSPHLLTPETPEVGTHPQCSDSSQAQISSDICPEHSKQDGFRPNK